MKKVSLSNIFQYNQRVCKYDYQKLIKIMRSQENDTEAATGGVLKNLAKFTGKHLCQGLLFNKAAGPRPATIFKKRLWHRCFPVSFAKFPKTPFYRTPLDDCF